MMCFVYSTALVSLVAWSPGFAAVLTQADVNDNHPSRAKVACTGVSDPAWEGSKCYSGKQEREYLTMRVNSFNAKTKSGSVSVLGSGVAPMKCERGFKKADQSMSIADIQECVSADIETTGVRYCTDQDHIIIDATVRSHAHEIVLQEAPCPSLFLEQGSLNDLYSHSAWIWDSPTCTGNSDPPAQTAHCYTGSKMGEVVTIKIDSFAAGRGSVLVTGSGLAALKCQRGFSKAEQLINVERLEECLPKTVKPEGIKFCSDQNQYLLDAHVGMLGVELALIPAPCPSFLLGRNSAEESVLERSSGGPWDWLSTSCTGSSDPPTHAPFCYSGTKMGETVTAKVTSFEKGIGSLTVAASGLRSVNCDRSFAKTLQMLEVKKLEECLPPTVKPQGVKYCSDQNSIILDAVVGPVPVEMVLIASPCPESLVEEHEMVEQISPSGSIIRRIVRKE
jgi:hypothetical protein